MIDANLYFKSFLMSFIATIIILVIMIPILRNIRCHQVVRTNGPKEHYKKNGTPTMGGLLILLSIFPIFVFYCSCFSFDIKEVFILLLPVLLYTILGFIDDYLIINFKNNKGLKARTKFLLQILIGVIYIFFLENMNFKNELDFYFFTVSNKIIYYVVIVLIFISTVNAVNISDGLDGLATGLVIICMVGIGIISYIKANNMLLLFSIIMIASLLAFLIYNANPAKIFMGNTGSLMLGSILSSMIIMLEEELLLIILSSVFIIETLSVILQVFYFKITKGKRLFLMSPLHHHFEKKGFSEWYVDLILWFIGLLSLGIALVFIL